MFLESAAIQSFHPSSVRAALQPRWRRRWILSNVLFLQRAGDNQSTLSASHSCFDFVSVKRVSVFLGVSVSCLGKSWVSVVQMIMVKGQIWAADSGRRDVQGRYMEPAVDGYRSVRKLATSMAGRVFIALTVPGIC